METTAQEEKINGFEEGNVLYEEAFDSIIVIHEV